MKLVHSFKKQLSTTLKQTYFMWKGLEALKRCLKENALKLKIF